MIFTTIFPDVIKFQASPNTLEINKKKIMDVAVNTNTYESTTKNHLQIGTLLDAERGLVLIVCLINNNGDKRLYIATDNPATGTPYINNGVEFTISKNGLKLNPGGTSELWEYITKNLSVRLV